MAKLRPGDKAPDFSLQNQNLETVKLSDFRGQRVLLYFYPKADTPGCTAQAINVRDALSGLKAAHVTVIGISPDAPDRQKRFDGKHNLGFHLLSDPAHRTADAYGAWGEKSMYGKKFEGIIRSSFLVDVSGAIVGAWYKVSPKDTAPKAMEALSSLPD